MFEKSHRLVLRSRTCCNNKQLLGLRLCMVTELYRSLLTGLENTTPHCTLRAKALGLTDQCYAIATTFRPGDLQTFRPGDLETWRPSDLETFRPAGLGSCAPLAPRPMSLAWLTNTPGISCQFRQGRARRG